MFVRMQKPYHTLVTIQKGLQVNLSKLCVGGVEAGSHFAVELERCLDAFLAPENGGSEGRSLALVGMERSLTHLALKTLELLTKVLPCTLTWSESVSPQHATGRR